MPKRMLIDASHPEETRVVVLDGNNVEEFDFESASRRPLKGNIYLAKVTRVEPSLQAAFVEYGGNRQGFLAFAEIHPDYYQIPVADRLALIEAQTRRMREEEEIFDKAAGDEAPAEAQTAEASESTEAESGESGGQTEDNAAGSEMAAEAAPSGDGQDSEHGEQEDEHVADHDGEHTDDEAPSPQDVVLHEDAREEAFGAHDDEGHDDHVHADDDHGHDDQDHSDAEHEHAEDHGSDEHADDHSGEGEEQPMPLAAGEEQPDGEPVQMEATGAPVPHERRQRTPRPRRRFYKIQEVIKRRQIMLVQVVKEERGNKGASLTTFLSLAGRYCVLMPNTPRGGGISRKITNPGDRKRLKSAAQSLELPEGMGLIIRTAGANRTKIEIKRDYEYLLRLWDSVRELTLKSNAPALVYEEGNLIKRAIRDLYNKDITEVIVEGAAGYQDAKEFMRMIMPSHAKNVRPYADPQPIMQKYHVDAQLDAMFSPVVTLKSGGYIVINQTEALVSIDVNSGKATREHSIEETATKTNLEAADEIGRQLRLRDLAGLIVIDFIDMEDGKHDRHVERRLREAVTGDRARIQVGKISQFGLLEMSRQRLRAGVLAGSTVTCPHCGGQGIVRSTESATLRLLRALDEEGQKTRCVNLLVKAPADVAIYALNQKRHEIARIEQTYDLGILFEPKENMPAGNFEIEKTGVRIPTPRPPVAVSLEAGFTEDEKQDETFIDAEIEAEEAEMAAEEARERAETLAEPPSDMEEPVHEGEQQGERSFNDRGERGGRRRRRRGRRGGRGGQGHEGASQPHVQNGNGHHQGHHAEPGAPQEDDAFHAPDDASGEGQHTEAHAGGQNAQPGQEGGEGRRRRRRRRGGRNRNRHRNDGQPHPQNGEHTSAFGSPELTPNEPSAPQWSLAPEAERSPPAQEHRAPEPQHPAERPAEPAPEPSGEAQSAPRKGGWWQRRFGL